MFTKVKEKAGYCTCKKKQCNYRQKKLIRDKHTNQQKKTLTSNIGDEL